MPHIVEHALRQAELMGGGDASAVRSGATLHLQDELRAHAYALGGLHQNFYIHEPERQLVSVRSRCRKRGSSPQHWDASSSRRLVAYPPAFPATGCFSGTKNRFAFTTVPGRSVQKLFLFTFCHTRFGR